MSTTRRGDYGLDAPYVPVGFAAASLLGLVAAFICEALGWRSLTVLSLIIAFLFVLSAANFLFTTKRGKFSVWSELLEPEFARRRAAS
jgi:arsenite methyltransferase